MSRGKMMEHLPQSRDKVCRLLRGWGAFFWRWMEDLQMKGRPGSASSEAVQNTDNGKLQVMCMWSAEAAFHTHNGGRGVRLQGRQAPGPVRSLALPVSWAGRHPADLEFPLGDGPRCPARDKDEVHQKGSTNKSLFWVALQAPAFWWLGCEPELRGDWKDLVGRKATNVSIDTSFQQNKHIELLPLWLENHYGNIEFFTWVVFFWFEVEHQI